MTPKEVEKIVKKDGWYLVSIEGSHNITNTMKNLARLQYLSTRSPKTCQPKP